MQSFPNPTRGGVSGNALLRLALHTEQRCEKITGVTLLSAVLGIVYRAIANFLSKEAGISEAPAQSGAVRLIQRFGSALNLNLHCHRLFLDGVYSTTGSGPRL